MPISIDNFNYESPFYTVKNMSVSSGGLRRTPAPKKGFASYTRPRKITDYHTEHTDNESRISTPKIGLRSQSLSALQPTAIIQPRMAQLETLEAKMASIEVSLSSATPRRKKCLPVSTPVSRNLMGSSLNPIDHLESLKNKLKDKENTSVRKNNNVAVSVKNLNISVSEIEKKSLEDKIHKIKIDVENKKMTIKNLKCCLDKLDITDNIDIRIQQAELEYQLGREELNLLSLLEELRSLQINLDETGSQQRKMSQNLTVFKTVTELGNKVKLLALQVPYNPVTPRFGYDISNNGIIIEWCDRDTQLLKGDRIIEINGKLLISRIPTINDIIRLFSLCLDYSQIVILRGNTDDPSPHFQNSEVSTLRHELNLVRERAEDIQKTKETLRTDNLRLTHRISYLEEQVSELLESRRLRKHHHHHGNKEQNIRVVTNNKQNITKIKIDDLQIYQKGGTRTYLPKNGCEGTPKKTPSNPCINIQDETNSNFEYESYTQKLPDARSVKSLELDASPPPNWVRKSLDYTSEPVTPISGFRKRPTPPKKPIRLSLHRAQSLQSVENDILSSQGPNGQILEVQGRKRTREKSLNGLRWTSGGLQGPKSYNTNNKWY